MWHSFTETSTQADIIFILDNDDPELEKYKKFFNTKDIKYYVRERQSTTNHINYTYEMNKNYGFYHLTNDDFVYRTNNWDRMFLNVFDDYGYGVAYGNDLYMGENLPTAPIISGELVNAIGWLQMPKLEHLCGDMVWKVLGEGLKSLYYVKNIIIDHKHPLNDREVEKDETYLRTNSKEMYSSDNAIFRKWLREDYYDDLKRIKDVINLGV